MVLSWSFFVLQPIIDDNKMMLKSCLVGYSSVCSPHELLQLLNPDAPCPKAEKDFDDFLTSPEIQKEEKENKVRTEQ